MIQRLNIRTASNVEIEYELASLWDRILATVIDHIIMLSYGTILFLALAGVSTLFPDRIVSIISLSLFALLMLPLIFYDLVLEVFLDGQSFGKKIVKIKVIKMDGSQPTLGNYFLRWLLRLIDTAASYGSIAIITILINGKGQRLGDIAAGTTVVKTHRSVTLDDTILAQIDDDYEPIFIEAGNLDVESLSTIKEVLNRTSNPKLIDPTTAEAVLLRTKQTLEKRMNQESSLPPSEFLETVLKDYTAITRS